MATTLLDIVQTVLTPLVMISAVGLLLLTLQNRYGRVIDRIRSFAEEVPQLHSRARFPQVRAVSLKQQLGVLLKRGKLLRNAMFCLYLGILCVLLTSMLIFMDTAAGGLFAPAMIAIFSVSLIFIITGLLFAIREMFISYDAVITQVVIEDGELS